LEPILFLRKAGQGTDPRFETLDKTDLVLGLDRTKMLHQPKESFEILLNFALVIFGGIVSESIRETLPK
jgi:hypothetical protein